MPRRRTRLLYERHRQRSPLPLQAEKVILEPQPASPRQAGEFSDILMIPLPPDIEHLIPSFGTLSIESVSSTPRLTLARLWPS